MLLNFSAHQQELLEDTDYWGNVSVRNFDIFVTELEGQFIKCLQVAENDFLRVTRIRNMLNQLFQNLLKRWNWELIDKFFYEKIQLWEVAFIHFVLMVYIYEVLSRSVDYIVD